MALFVTGGSRLSAILITIFMLLSGFLSARGQQTTIDDIFVDYERVLHIGGVTPVRSVSNQPYRQEYLSLPDTLDHPWGNLPSAASRSAWRLPDGNGMISLYDPEMHTYWRNLKPGGINNGAAWEGRGVTTSWTTGFFVRYRFLSASVRPAVLFNQNRDFPLSRYPARGSRNEFSSPFYHIDIPQRFGENPFWTFDPGPGYVRAEFFGMEAGLSNQNRWWGPAMHYPIIMSNNAPGFRHVFFGTRSPQNIHIGEIDATVIWGKLQESDFFDDQDFNDQRYITGLTMSFAPRPVPGLTLGLARVYTRFLPPEGIPMAELLKPFEAFTKSNLVSEERPSGGDSYNQILSFFGRWVLPRSGFEIYGEWARNDHAWNLRDAMGEPDHARAYMAGFQKSFVLPNRNLLAINAEIVNMESSNTGLNRGRGSFYTHSRVYQGYTNQGQVMGVGLGPGSSSQLLKGKYWFGSGMVAGWVRRSVYDNDFFYRSNRMMSEPENTNVPKYWLHNFELGFGASLVWFFRQWEGEAGLELMREFNEDFLYKNDKTIVALQFRLRYRLSAFR